MRITAWFLIAFLLLLAGLIAACGSSFEPENGSPSTGQSVETAEGQYFDITPQQLHSVLKNKDFPLVNVHVPYQGEIDGTGLFIPFDQIEENLNKLPAERDSRIVLYCRSGSMSSKAARRLVSLGYTNVRNLDGGMIAWEEAGYPLISEPR